MKSQKYVDLDFDNTWSNFNMAKVCYGVLQNGISDDSCPSLFSEFSSSYDISATQFLPLNQRGICVMLWKIHFSQ